MLSDRTVVEFQKWLHRRMIRIGRYPEYIVVYKVNNTTIRRIKLRNGETIETYIKD